MRNRGSAVSPRISRLVAALAGLGLALAIGWSVAPRPEPGSAERGGAPGVAGLARPMAPAAGERLTALVQLELPPLAAVGRAWGHEQRRAHLAQLAAAQDAVGAAVEDRGGQVIARFSHAAAGLAVLIDAAAAAGLSELPGVRAVVRVSDYQAQQGEPPAAASLAELSALIGADEVRRRGNDGRGVAIALVDTGVDYTHQKLGGPGDPAAYRRAVCGSPDLEPGAPGCANGQGAPPADLFPNLKVRGGYDFLGDRWPSPDPRCGGLIVCALPDPNPVDLSGHGTHAADIAAGLPATPGGADGGVAPGADLWAFKACNGPAGLCEGVALLSALDAALDLDGSDRGACTPGLTPGCRAYDPADVISLSLSFPYGQPEDALALFADVAGYYGSLVVAAAGNDGDRPYIIGSPATASAALAVAESSLPAPDPGAPGATVERIAPDASRGPRINDTALKPDLAAPGAVLSARVGTGTGLAPFGGSSGAAPVAAGAAALVIQELNDKGLLDVGPGLGVGDELRLSLAPLVKAVLMNSAYADLRTADGGPAPLSLQGAGRISALDSFVARTLAWDGSAMIDLLAGDPALANCSVTPYVDLLNYIFFKIPPPCAAQYPGGDPLFQAWNAQAGSISFGYRPVAVAQRLTRQVVVHNYARSPRSYALSTGLRFADDVGRGVELAVTPTALSLPGGGFEVVTLTMTLSPSALRDWTLNGGSLGAAGSAACASPTPERDCPSLTLFEVDGALIIDGGPRNRVALPIHVLPHRAADVVVSRVSETEVLLENRAAYEQGAVEAFALVDSSPNKCDLVADGVCVDGDYRVGSRPGLGRSPTDIRFVGLRSASVPGLNLEHGFPPAPAGALADELIEFAVTVFDRPYRASPNVPLQFEVHIDADRNGLTDYVVYNADLGGGRDGRSAVFVQDVNPVDGTRPTRAYRFTDADLNTQSWVLPVPAAAVDLRSDQPFTWYVLAYDAYFLDAGAGPPWDCSPGPATACGSAAHTTQTGALRFRPAVSGLAVPPESAAALPYGEDAGGPAGSPSQIGLLLLHRDALPGQGASEVLIR